MDAVPTEPQQPGPGRRDADGTRPRRPRADAVRRHREIVDAARQVFCEKGLDAARTKEIAAAAGVTETVMYRYFPSKDALFEAAIIGPLEEMLGRLYPGGADAIALAETDEDRAEAIRGYAQGWLEAMDEILPLLGNALFSRDGKRFYQQHLYPLLLRIIDGAPSTLRGWGRPSTDPTVLVLTMFGVNFMIALDRHYRDSRIDLAELAPKVADQIVLGVAHKPPATAAVARPPSEVTHRP